LRKRGPPVRSNLQGTTRRHTKKTCDGESGDHLTDSSVVVLRDGARKRGVSRRERVPKLGSHI